MATRVPVSIQYQRPEGRADFERARRALQSSLGHGSADDAAAALAELGSALDTGVARIKRELVGSSLCWNEDNQRLAAWIQDQNRKLADMGEQLALAEARRPGGELALRLAALTLLHRGEALKWLQGRARRDYAPLHGLYAMMRAAGNHRADVTVLTEGRGRAATIEGLYFRALLLDRFASGNLTRAQLEVLDAWLWEWMPRLVGRDAAPEGRCLRADLDANAGLREGAREDGGAALYLPLATLEGLRRAVLAELHRGRMVPAHGCASEMRIEEHVSVLDRLRRAFDPAGEAREQRAQRRQSAGTKVEIWVGLAEILRHGAGVGPERGELPALSLVESPLVAKQGKLPPPRAEGAPDPTLRYLWQADVSATGFGFEALEGDAAGLEVGEVVGWRREPGGPCVLGKVTRRLASATDGQVFIGVHLLSDAAQPLALRCATAFGEGASHTFLYVPGDDDSGRHDAFLVPESTFEEPSAYDVRIAERRLTLRFNRTRARGRGWVLAGFEVLPVRDAAPAAPRASGSGELELVLDEDLLDRALSREVGSRLLS
jgi:hypothetical protein